MSLFFMATIKQNVYRSNPHTIEETKENIQKEVLSLSQQEFKCMNVDFLQRFQESMEKNRHNF
jgi:DNA-binding winged helix-turn-helix (wHTH) protein